MVIASASMSRTVEAALSAWPVVMVGSRSFIELLPRKRRGEQRNEEYEEENKGVRSMRRRIEEYEYEENRGGCVKEENRQEERSEVDGEEMRGIEKKC